MRNLGKVLKTAKVEKKNWKVALLAFLKVYRATPHSTTGHPPASLMFNGRKYNTKILDGNSHMELVHQKEVRDNDKKKKDQYKARADQRTHAKKSRLQEGDWALCRQQKVNKTTTPYNPDPYFITSIKGSTNSEHSITRHIYLFKG